MRLRQLVLALAVYTMSLALHAQDRNVPHYCKTDAGVLGPYPNDGSVGVGDPCFGTKNGRRYEGVAVMKKTSDEDKDSGDTGSKRGGTSQGAAKQDRNVPHYCKTDAGVLGPYPNDGSVGVGDPCFGTKNGRRYEGVGVMKRTSDEDEDR
jgi:hypothetical protein